MCSVGIVSRGSAQNPLKVAHSAHLLIHIGAKSLDLSYEVEEFKRICTFSDKYNHDLNFLAVAHVKK